MAKNRSNSASNSVSLQGGFLDIIDEIKKSNQITGSIADSIKSLDSTKSLALKPAEGLHPEIEIGLLNIANIAAILREIRDDKKWEEIVKYTRLSAERILILAGANGNIGVVNPVTSINSNNKPTGATSSLSTPGERITKISNYKGSRNRKGDNSIEAPGIGNLLKGLMLNFTPQFIFDSYANGIQKLVNVIKTIDTTLIDDKLKPLLVLSRIVKEIQSIRWIGVLKGALTLRSLSFVYTMGIRALVDALSTIAIPKGTEERIRVFSHILDPFEVLQKFKFRTLLLGSSLLKTITENIVAGIAPLTAISLPRLEKLKKVGITLQEVFIPISKFLSSIASSLMKGALGIALLGASLLPFVFSMKQMEGIKEDTIATLAKGLVVLAIAGGVLGLSLPVIAAGALGIALLGASLFPFIVALEALQTIDWEIINAIGPALLSLAEGVIPLILAGPGLALGSIGLGLFAGGLKLLSIAMNNDSAKSLTTFVTSLTDLTKNVTFTKLKDIALGVGALVIGIAALGAGTTIDGILSFFGKKLGLTVDPIAQLISLAERGSGITLIGDGLTNIAKGLSSISAAADGLKVLMDLDPDKLERIAKFQKAVSAGYTSWDDYKSHDWKDRNAITPIELTTGTNMNSEASRSLGGQGSSSSPIVVNNINTGGNISSNSSNIMNSVMMASVPGSGIPALWDY